MTAEIKSLEHAGPLDGDERDFILLTVYVLAQHGYVERATELVEGSTPPATIPATSCSPAPCSASSPATSRRP
jgi:hypothetical protein